MRIGVDFGGTRIKAGVVEGSRVVARATCDTPGGGASPVLDAIARLVSGLGHATRLGVAIPGEVNGQGLCWRLPNVPGFEGVAIARELERRLGCPVSVQNDATAACIAEQRFGHGLSFGNFVLVTLGTGVGGGVCIGGHVLTGRSGFAGEIGHVLVSDAPDARLCGCGLRGCVEAYCGTRGLLEAFAARGGKAREVAEIAHSARAGEAAGRETLDEMGVKLGVALGSIQNTLDLEAFVFTGGIAASLDLIEPGIRRGLRSRVFARPLADVALVPSALGEDAGIIGAAWLE